MLDEKDCLFVSSFGIAKSMEQSPIMFKDYAQYNFNYNNQYGETVYVRVVDVPIFFNSHINNFKEPIILITGDMDTTVPDDISNCLEYCNNPKILLWYAQNLNSNNFHEKLKHLPIGLDYHTLNLYNGHMHDWGNKISPLEQEKELLLIKQDNDINNVIKNKAVTNFQLTINGYYSRREVHRKFVFDNLKDNLCVIWLEKQKRIDFWKTCTKYAFVICPFGNGLDTHRTWETLCLGRIPIISKSPLNHVFEGLPILEIDDWNKINEEFLEEQFKNIIEKWDTYNWEKLNLKYWIDKIHNLNI
jgi:hypothetical protein